MEQKYKLNDGIYIFRSCDKHTLIIRNYNLGICSKVKYQNKLYKLLLQLTTPKSIDELNKVVSNISKSKIINIITVLREIIRCYSFDRILKGDGHEASV